MLPISIKLYQMMIFRVHYWLIVKRYLQQIQQAYVEEKI